MKNSFKKTGLIVLILLFYFATNKTISAQVSTKEFTYVKIEIRGMACPFCAFGMEKELKKIAGVNNVEIELKEGFAFISVPIIQEPTKESLEKIIIDAGFTVGEIKFSDKPFTIKKGKE